MADLPQYQLPNPGLPLGVTPNTGIAQTNPLMNLNQGLQNGAQLGLQFQQNKRAQQELELQKQAAQQKQLEDSESLLKTFGNMHEQYAGVPSMQKQILLKGLIPAYNQVAQLSGRPDATIDPSQVDFDAHAPAIKELMSLQDNYSKGKVKFDQYANGVHAIELNYFGNEKVQQMAEKQLNDNRMSELLKMRESSQGQKETNQFVTPEMAETVSGVKSDVWKQQYPDGNVPLSVVKASVPVSTKTNLPTTQMRNMGEMANTILPHISDMRQLINEADAKGYIGPTSGRIYGQFLAGKVGSTGNPDADKLLGQLRTSNSLVNTAMIRTHFGARGGQMMYDKFTNLLNTGKQSAAMLNGALDTYESYAKGYAKSGGLPVDETKNPANPMSQEDLDAIDWANAHPSDPRSKSILKVHGM